MTAGRSHHDPEGFAPADVARATVQRLVEPRVAPCEGGHQDPGLPSRADPSGALAAAERVGALGMGRGLRPAADPERRTPGPRYAPRWPSSRSRSRSRGRRAWSRTGPCSTPGCGGSSVAPDRARTASTARGREPDRTGPHGAGRSPAEHPPGPAVRRARWQAAPGAWSHATLQLLSPPGHREPRDLPPEWLWLR